MSLNVQHLNENAAVADGHACDLSDYDAAACGQRQEHRQTCSPSQRLAAVAVAAVCLLVWICWTPAAAVAAAASYQ